MSRRSINCILVLAFSTSLSAQSPLVWFSPLDPLFRPNVGYGGSPQYMQLFTRDAPWQQAAAHLNVFKIYPQWAAGASDADLRAQFADLNRRGIALALEWGMLTPSDACGRGIEGFGGPSTLGILRRIQRLGGKLAYIAMDEPIFFGTLYNGSHACRWTLDEMAQNAAANIQAVQEEFPEIVVGDIEPLPVDDVGKNWLDQYARGIDALQAAMGAPLAFFHCDIAWSSPRWPDALASMRGEVALRALPFGVIYNGDNSQQSDAYWLRAAEAHMTTYEGAADPPDYVIFQSWNASPRKLLPETDPVSFTNLIGRYFRVRSQMAASLEHGVLSGALTGAGPVADAPVHITATPASGDGIEAQYVIEGVTPAGVRQIVFAARVNVECGCHGASDFKLRAFRFESGDTVILGDFTAGLTGWGVSDSDLTAVEDGQLHVRADRGQPLIVNSAPDDYTDENVPFKLRVTATVPPGSAGTGYFAVVFLAGKELGRATTAIAAHEQSLGDALTDEDGRFRFALPPLAPLDWLVRAAFAGNADLWPATAEIMGMLH